MSFVLDRAPLRCNLRGEAEKVEHGILEIFNCHSAEHMLFGGDIVLD